MRKLFLLAACLLLGNASLMGQAVPQAINYQAVARDASGNLIANQSIGIKINILEGSAFGPVEYSETHAVTTNQFGLFTLQVGRGLPVTGTFSTVTWTDADQWMQVELDPSGGTNYFLMGSSELLSVPYALFAEKVGNVTLGLGDLTDVDLTGLQTGQVIKWNGTNWVPADDENTTYSAGPGLVLVGTTFEHAPHTGDAVGVQNLTVVGLQNVPVSSQAPQAGELLVYNQTTNAWEPQTLSGGQLLFAGNGIAIVNDTVINTVWTVSGADIYRDTGSVAVGAQAADPSAILDLTADDRGFLPPRLTTQERDSINNPAMGLVIFNRTDSTLQYFNGDCWVTTFQEGCDDCLFDIAITDTAGVINRTTSDTTGTDVILNQTGGTPQGISLFLLHNLPAGATATLSNYSIFSSGTSRLTVEADVFAEPGVYPVAIQAICGDRIKIQSFAVTIDSCFEVTLTGNVQDYDLQAANGLPTAVPICVVLTVPQGVEVSSSSTGNPALNTGNLAANSQVGLRNQGAILAQGGDGGAGGSFGTFGDPGTDGGDAIHLSARTNIDNAGGYIFSGGGGGGSVALQVLSIPGLGTLSFGAGGGGGAALGTGGTSLIPILYASGQNGTGGVSGQGGAGGNLNQPIAISIPGFTITVTPTVVGGDGGGYGQDGQVGVLFVNVDVAVQFIGSIFNQNFPDPPPSLLPAAGQAGMAIKRFGNLLISIQDGNYQTLNLKGEVGN
ncbi:MAG: hypothetical protein AAGN35_03125 [Bacteroidota bacterium]